MSIWGRAKAKAEELLGRAEQVYGESHGDAAATVAGEAHVMEAHASEDRTSEDTASEDTASEDTASEDTASEDTAAEDALEARDPAERRTDDDGIDGSR